MNRNNQQKAKNTSIFFSALLLESFYDMSPIQLHKIEKGNNTCSNSTMLRQANTGCLENIPFNGKKINNQ